MKCEVFSIVRALTYLSLTILLFGCGEQEISGQIFVVTQAKDNIKLALVNVTAIPQEEFDQYLKVKKTQKLEQQKLLYLKYKRAKEDLPLQEEYFNASSNWANLLSDLHPKRQQTKLEEKLMEDTKATIAAYKATLAEYEAFDNTEFLMDGLPNSKFISKTDADGRFTLTLPKGKYVIAANSNRNVINVVETYHWLVWVDSSSANQKLMLSNDNLLETRCNTCVKF